MAGGRKRHILNTTVCIVGTHPNTRGIAPYQDYTVDIWAFNNQAVQGWMPRIDAIFDMHHPNDIHRRRFEHQPFDDFLKKSDKPIYTPYAIPDCPANVVYPLDEVIADLFPNWKRGNEVNKYFTSGPAFALALAIHMGYKKILFYGIEMESNSEYVYQRDGIGLMFGIALGRGIEVVIPKESMMFFAPYYGYDDDASKLDREAFEQKASELQIVLEQTGAQLQSARGAIDVLNAQVQQMQQAGAPTEEIKTKLGKQFESAQHQYEQALANHAYINGMYTLSREFQGRVEKAMEFNGKAQELQAQTHEKWSRIADKVALNPMGQK